MKKFKVPGLLALLAFVAVSAWAADPSGKWQAEFQTPNGNTVTSTFNLKADGEKLTGTVSGRMGETPIEDGKVSGDEISFTVTRKFQDNEFKLNYKGKVAADKIDFHVTAGEREFDMTAKKVS